MQERDANGNPVEAQEPEPQEEENRHTGKPCRNPRLVIGNLDYFELMFEQNEL